MNQEILRTQPPSTDRAFTVLLSPTPPRRPARPAAHRGPSRRLGAPLGVGGAHRRRTRGERLGPRPRTGPGLPTHPRRQRADAAGSRSPTPGATAPPQDRVPSKRPRTTPNTGAGCSSWRPWRTTGASPPDPYRARPYGQRSTSYGDGPATGSCAGATRYPAKSAHRIALHRDAVTRDINYFKEPREITQPNPARPSPDASRGLVTHTGEICQLSWISHRLAGICSRHQTSTYVGPRPGLQSRSRA
ncbi:hypothetical protein SMICM304S_01973 [Streptomyces microflavus]